MRRAGAFPICGLSGCCFVSTILTHKIGTLVLILRYWTFGLWLDVLFCAGTPAKIKKLGQSAAAFLLLILDIYSQDDILPPTEWEVVFRVRESGHR